MRLSSKLSLAVGATSIAVLGVYGVYQIRQEKKDLSQAIEREVRLLGSAVRTAVSNALRDQQIEDVGATLASMEAVQPSLDVYVFDPHQKLIAASGREPDLPLVRELAAAADARIDPVYRLLGPDPFYRALLAFHLQDPQGRLEASVVVVKDLDDAQRDMLRTRFSIWLSIIGLVVAIWGVVYLLGHFQIKRPLATMIAMMRSLRAGQYSLRPQPQPSRDEIGEAIGEFNALAGELREARLRLASETEARRELEEGLLRVDKLITVGQLAAGLAHEIGSPLQILNGRAHALLAAADKPQEVRRHADILVAQTERVAHIVEQLLSYSRRVPPHLVECDLRPVLEGVVELVDVQAHRKGIKLELQIASGLPPVVVDRDRIQQVVLNLINNALRATPSGGRISVEVAPCVLTVGTASDQAGVRIVVEDTGCGMDEEAQVRAFEPFFTTAADSGGTGLGLATARMIVLEHSGRIAVQSRPGVGSRFIIELPLRPPEAAGREGS